MSGTSRSPSNTDVPRNNHQAVWVNDCSSGGIYIYLVMVGHSVYDELISTKPLSWQAQADIAQGYREALENYEGIRSD